MSHPKRGETRLPRPDGSAVAEKPAGETKGQMETVRPFAAPILTVRRSHDIRDG